MVRQERWMSTNLPSNLSEALAAVNCHQPARLQHEFQANAGLVKRLSHTQSLKGHSSSVNALDWSSNGEVLLSGSDDCRVKLWNTESSRAVLSFDSVRAMTVCITQAHAQASSPCYTQDFRLNAHWQAMTLAL